MSSHDIPLMHDHPAETYATASCYQCRFVCGSLVSRTEKGHGDTFGEVLQRRLSRRGLLKAGAVISAVLATGQAVSGSSPRVAEASTAAAPVAAQESGAAPLVPGHQAGHFRQTARRRRLLVASADLLGRSGRSGARRSTSTPRVPPRRAASSASTATSCCSPPCR